MEIKTTNKRIEIRLERVSFAKWLSTSIQIKLM
jgi:hypothetical protein